MKMLLVTDIMINKNEAYDVEVPKAVINNTRMLKEFLKQEALLNREVTFGYQELPHGCYSTEDINCNENGLDLSYADHYDGWLTIKVQALVKNYMVMHYTAKDERMFDNDIDQVVFHELLERIDVEFLITDPVWGERNE